MAVRLFHSVRLPWLLLGVTGAAVGLIFASPVLPSPLRTGGHGATPVSRAQLAMQRGDTRSVERLQAAVDANPDDFVLHLDLAVALLEQVRGTADPSIYTRVDQVLNDAARLSPEAPALFAARAELALARGQYVQALELGDDALSRSPGQARTFALIADAQLGMGQYDEARNSLNSMTDTEVGFEAYIRVARLREVHGDLPGAAALFQSALKAGSPLPEHLAAVQVDLGRLAYLQGDHDGAAEAYAAAFALVPGYADALAGEGELAMAQGDLPRAIDRYTRAYAAKPLLRYAIALADLYAATGNAPLTALQNARVLELDARWRANGVDTDTEMALFRADRRIDPAATVALARATHQRQPSVQTADALAWALYQAGEHAEAQTYAVEALRLGSPDPLMHYHAARIEMALGHGAAALAHLDAATAANPRFSPRYADDAAAMRAALANPGS